MRSIHLASFLFVTLSLPAGGESTPTRTSDYEMATEAVTRGDFMPLDQILDIVSLSHPGRLVELDLEMENGRWVYEVELITPQGRLIEVELDAATGDILTVEDDDDD